MSTNYYAPDTYKNIKLEKGMYEHNNKSFLQILEELDPTENYEGTPLANLDAFQRQLKRFDIKVSGRNADKVDKFFKSDETRILFSEYARRVIESNIPENSIYEKLIGNTIHAENTNNREVVILEEEKEKEIEEIQEGDEIPKSNLKITYRHVKPIKIGQAIEISREAMWGKNINDFSFLLKDISKQFSTKLSKDAVKTIIEGDGNDNAAQKIEINSKKFTPTNIYTNILELNPCNCDVILLSTEAMKKILEMQEALDPKAGINYITAGTLNKMFGADIVIDTNLKGCIIALISKKQCLSIVKFQDLNLNQTQLVSKDIFLMSVTMRYAFIKKSKKAAIMLSLT